MSTSSTDSAALAAQMTELARKARAAALTLGTLETARKNAILETLAALLEARQQVLLEANQRDIDMARLGGLPEPMIDRLKFTPARIAAIAKGVREVAALPDPVGEELETTTRPNGLVIRKIRVPIGVIAIIYESRPNVTIDCAALCLKSGNAAILRGGSEAFHSNSALAALISEALAANAVDPAAIQLVPTTDRAALQALLKLDAYIHCVIPRGGESLIRMVAETSTIPVIKHYKGVCNVYLDKAADPELAEKITINAKCQRPSVCNAAENLLVHRDVAPTLLPRVAHALARAGVELRVDDEAYCILEPLTHAPGPDRLCLVSATEQDFFEEYLDLILAVKVVPSTQAAIDAINHYGSGHSDAIVTRDEAAARAFLAGVDSATVYWNASTRFTDGFEFGLGAEIGISTDRLHARGPMGLRELCTYKYLVLGTGQTRG